jgi:uncharacterized protein YigA (DUF484 family)
MDSRLERIDANMSALEERLAAAVRVVDRINRDLRVGANVILTRRSEAANADRIGSLEARVAELERNARDNEEAHRQILARLDQIMEAVS